MKCSDCLTYKRGDNCQRCYKEQKRRYLRLVADLRLILATTGYYLVAEKVRIRLDSEEEA